jgi:hypothetical protein
VDDDRADTCELGRADRSLYRICQERGAEALSLPGAVNRKSAEHHHRDTRMLIVRSRPRAEFWASMAGIAFLLSAPSTSNDMCHAACRMRYICFVRTVYTQNVNKALTPQPSPPASPPSRPLIGQQRGHPSPFLGFRVQAAAQIVAFVLQQRHLFAQSLNIGL